MDIGHYLQDWIQGLAPHDLQRWLALSYPLLLRRRGQLLHRARLPIRMIPLQNFQNTIDWQLTEQSDYNSIGTAHQLLGHRNRRHHILHLPPRPI